MEYSAGLYVTVLPEDKIKKDLVTKDGKIQHFESLIADDLIAYVEEDYDTYGKMIDYICSLQIIPRIVNGRRLKGIDSEKFQLLLDFRDDSLRAFEEQQPIAGALRRAHLESILPSENWYCRNPRLIRESLIRCLQEVMNIQQLINKAMRELEKGTLIPEDEEFSSLLYSEFTQIISLEDELIKRYYFRSEAEYCKFLLIHFIASKPNVVRCRCCGKYFLPKTRKRTLYCDRTLKNGKTCKAYGPHMKHAQISKREKVIEEFDRAKQRMYKRYERALYSKRPSKKDISYSEYLSWRNAASDARDKFLAGELTEEEALAIIIVP